MHHAGLHNIQIPTPSTLFLIALWGSTFVHLCIVMKFILESSITFYHYSSSFLVIFQMMCSKHHLHSFYSY